MAACPAPAAAQARLKGVKPLMGLSGSHRFAVCKQPLPVCKDLFILSPSHHGVLGLPGALSLCVSSAAQPPMVLMLHLCS